MKTFITSALTAVLLCFLVCIAIKASAQKLPAIQQGSLYAPDSLKIDGKATEWGNKFEAYSKHTGTYYSIANDGQNLYLVIQATEFETITKIVSGGITFTVNKSGKKDKSGISVTYPVFNSRDKPNINLKDKPKIDPTLPATTLRADSFMNANNNRFTNKSKYIKLAGIPVLDTLISVYNDTGIKAAALFNNIMVYTYELCIPLKYLNIDSNSGAKFNYGVTVNGVSRSNFNGISEHFDATGKLMGVVIAPGTIKPGMASMSALGAPTDFWGEYMLAKK